MKFHQYQSLYFLDNMLATSPFAGIPLCCQVVKVLSGFVKLDLNPSHLAIESEVYVSIVIANWARSVSYSL
jgi:hypothetical protein